MADATATPFKTQDDFKNWLSGQNGAAKPPEQKQPAGPAFKTQDDFRQWLDKASPKPTVLGTTAGVNQKTPADLWHETHDYLFGKQDQPKDPGVVGKAWQRVKATPAGVEGVTIGQDLDTLKGAWDRFNNPFAMSNEQLAQHAKARDAANKAIDDKLPTASLHGQDKLGRYVMEGVENTAENFLSPMNVALMFTGYGEAKLAGAIGKEAAGVLGKLASTYWTAQMIEGTGENTKESYNAFMNGDYETGIKAAVGGIVNGFMAGHSFTHQVAQERVARDLDKKSQELYGQKTGMSVKGRFAQLSNEEKAHVVYEAVKNMPLYTDLGGEKEKLVPNKKRAALIEHAQLEPPPAFSDSFNARVDEAVARQEETEKQRAGLNAYVDAEKGRQDQRAAEMQRLDKSIEERTAEKRPSQESAQILDYPILSDHEREFQRHEYEAEQARKTLETERNESLRVDEDRKSRQKLYEAQQDENQDAVKQEMLRNGQMFSTVDRRANVSIREEMQAALRERLTPERETPETISYQQMSEEIRQHADNLFPGADPAIVDERLRAKERDGYNLSQYEQDYRRRYDTYERAENGLARNKEMAPQAYKMVEALRRQQVEDTLHLAKREEDLVNAAEELQRKAETATTPEEAEEIVGRAQEARKLAEEIRGQRQDLQARRGAAEETERPQEQPPISARTGRKTRIDLPGNARSMGARYAAVKLSDLKISHDPLSFQWRDNYRPRRLQPRDLSTNMQAQEAIITSSKPENYRHDRYTSDNPTAIEGPAVILPDGTVAGGNSRLARLIRALQTERRGEIITRIHSDMAKLGMETEDLYDGSDPYIPVRILDEPPKTIEDMIKLGQDLNTDTIMGFSTEEQAVMSGERLTPENVETISAMLDTMPESASLREMLTARSDKILDMMTDSGIIPETKRAEYITQDGKLTERAKQTFEEAILGKVIDDPDLLKSVPRETLAKVERSLPALLKIKTAAPEWNVMDYLKQSLRVWRTIDSIRGDLNDIGAKSDSLIDKYYNPQDFKMGSGLITFEEGALRDPPHPITEALAKLFEKNPLQVKKALDAYADDVEGRQNYMLGQPSPIEAFNRHIGEKVGVEVDPTEWGTLRPTGEEVQEEARKATLPPDLPKTPAKPQVLEPPPAEKKAEKAAKPVEPSPVISQPVGTIEVPQPRLEAAGAARKAIPEVEVKSGKISRTVDMDGRPFAPIEGENGTTRLVAMFTPGEWGNRPKNQPGETVGKVVRHKGREWVLGGPDSEVVMKPGPTPQEASQQLRSAVEDGSVTTEGLRRLFESSPGTADAAPELMRIFGQIIPNATGMKLDDFLREKLADVRTGKEEELHTVKGLGQSVKGATHFLNDGKAIISLFERADPTTVMHEFFHVMRRYVRPEDMAALEEFAKVKDGKWDEDAEEKAARAWERYHRDGNAPTPEIKSAFDKLSDIFLKVYQTVKGSPLAVKVTRSVRETFDKWYGAEAREMEPPPGHDRIPAPKETADVLTPNERENSKLIAKGGADITSRLGEARLKRFDHPDEAKAFAANNYEKLRKGIQIWQTQDGKSYALFIPDSPTTLYQRDPENMQEAIHRVDQLKRQLASESDFGRMSSMRREIDRLESKHGIGNMLTIGAPVEKQKTNIIKPGEMERPPDIRRPEEPTILFPDTEASHGRDTNAVRTVSDGPVLVPERGKAEGVAGRSGERRLAPSDRGSLLPVRDAGRTGSHPARGTERNSLSGTTPNAVAKPQRERGPALVDQQQWRERMQTLNMPHETPPPTVSVSVGTAILLKFPGQREVVETSLSALQQYDGTIVATPPGTGKTYTVLAIAKELKQPGHRQLIITRNNDIITADKGFQDVGKKIFNMEVKRLPDDLNKIGEGTYAMTYATLREHPELKNTAWDLVIADEAGEARRWWDSKQGGALADLSDSATKMVYASATPYHTALEIGYMKKLGLWEGQGFDEWARQFGVRKNKEGKYSGGTSPKKLIKMRQQLIERGQYAYQSVNYDGYRAEFAHVPLSEEHIKGIQNIRTAFAEMENFFNMRGKPQLAAAVRGNGVNYMKNYLERVRLPQAIEVAKRLNREGWQVAIFSEHNQERAELYDFAKEADRAMGGRISQLLPKLPGVYDTLENEFGDNIANFSGSFSAKRQGEKKGFLTGAKDYLFATYGAGGIGTSLHDDSPTGMRPRAAIYLGPPWSGVMLDQALGRLWRFGTKSNVHSIFMSSNAKPEVNMILTKIAPRMEALRAAIAGVDGNDPLVTAMRSLDRTRDELANYDMGGQQKIDISDFDFLQDDVPIANYKDIGIVSAENAKDKGMRYAGQVDETPGVITLFQEHGDLNVPPPFKSPEQHKVESYVSSVSKDLAEGNAVPGAPEGIQGIDTSDRTKMADGMGPDIQRQADIQGEADKQATARIASEASIAHILAAQRAGDVKLDPESPEWSMTYPLGEAEARARRSEETYRVTVALNGRQQIESNAAMAGRADIGRSIHNDILDYHATGQGITGRYISDWYKVKKEIGGISKKEFRTMVMVKEGKIPSPSEKISKAVAGLTGIFNGVRQTMEDRGIENKRYIDGKPTFVTFADIPENPNFFPHRWNHAEKIEVTDPTTGETESFTLAQLIGGTLGEQRRNRILAAISKEHGISIAEVEDWLQQRKTRTPVAGNIERSRQANMPFYRMDESALFEYLDNVGEVLAREEVFGQDRGKLDGKVSQIPNAKSRETINNIMDSLLSPAPWSNTRMQQLYRKFTTANVLMKMTFSTVKLPGHLAHTMLVQGQVRQVLKAVMQSAASPREARERALFSGALSDQVIAHAATDEGVSKGFANKMLNYTGFHAMYNVDRIIANKAAQNWMEKYALPRLIKKSKSSDYVRRQLKEIYLLPDEKIDAAIENGRWSKEDIDRGGVALTNKTLFVNDPTEVHHSLRPNARSDMGQNMEVVIRTMTMLKGFTFRTAALLKERLFDEARQGNYRAWVPFILAYPVIGEALRFGSAAVRGTAAAMTNNPNNPFEKYVEGWEDLFEDPSVAKFAARYIEDEGASTGLEMFSHIFNAIVLPVENERMARLQRSFILPDFIEYLGGGFTTLYDTGKAGIKAINSEGDREKFAQAILDYVREEAPAVGAMLPKKMKDIYEFEPFPANQ